MHCRKNKHFYKQKNNVGEQKSQSNFKSAQVEARASLETQPDVPPYSSVGLTNWTAKTTELKTDLFMSNWWALWTWAVRS